MKTYFTSDHHFGHTNIIKLCNRPFNTLDEMHEVLIERYNSIVLPEDRVYFLGDVFWNTRSKNLYWDRLNGIKIVVPGGHDRRIWKMKHDIIMEVSIDSIWYVLCHYPLCSWNGSYHGAIHLHGHSHGRSELRYNRLDIGVDLWDFYPVELEKVKEKIKYFEKTLDKPYPEMV